MIYLAADHAGFELKEKIKLFLADLDYETRDFGSFSYNKDDDYPDFISPLAEELQKDIENGGSSKAVIFGFSGQGEAICANRHKNIRAAVFYGGPKEIIKLAREPSNVNVLSLAAGFISEEDAKNAVKLFLEIKFPSREDLNSERHLRRVKKLM